METEEILSKLKELMKRFCNSREIDYDSITLDTKLLEELGFTSLETLMMALAIEKEFDFEFGEIGPSIFKDVRSIVEYIKERA